MSSEIEIAEKMSYDEMVRYGWIEEHDKWAERVVCLRKFFELAHIIYGHVGKEEGTTEEDEKLADEYAHNLCYNIFNN